MQIIGGGGPVFVDVKRCIPPSVAVEVAMELFLVQHGQAKSEVEDPERSLTERGAETVQRMAAWAAQVGVRVDQIRHSGKRRAEQTAALLAERLCPPQGMIAVPGLAPDDDVHPVAEALQGEPGAVML